MNNSRRTIIIIASVFTGTVFSFLLFKSRRGAAPLTDTDQTTLITNFGFSLAILLGIGFFFIWNKKKD